MPEEKKITKETVKKPKRPGRPKKVVVPAVLTDKKSDLKAKPEAEETMPIGEAVEEAVSDNKKGVYIYAVGKRKSAVAQVKLFKNGKGNILINGKDYKEYFPVFQLQEIVSAAVKSVGQSDKLDFQAKVRGGGKIGQAESIRHGMARTLIQLNPNFKRNLRKAGYITRDSRVKERKKPGLKGARRAPQWQKR